PVDIVGVLRWAEHAGMFTPAAEPARNLWFARDPLAIAAAKGWGNVAPFYVEQEAPVPPGGLPQPGKLTVNLPNNHLQYALTWFSLAAVLIAVFVAFARARRREKPASDGHFSAVFAGPTQSPISPVSTSIIPMGLWSARPEGSDPCGTFRPEARHPRSASSM